MSLFTRVCPKCGGIAGIKRYGESITWICDCGHSWIEQLGKERKQ